MAKRPSGYIINEYGQDMAIVNTRTQAVLLFLALVLLFTAPLFAGRMWSTWITFTAIYLIAALGLQVITGLTGQISVGQAAFMGFGAFAGGVLITQLHWPFLLSLLLAGLVAGVVGTIFSLSCFRLKGFYLALVTLAAHIFLPFVVNHLPKWTGSTGGLRLPTPSIAGFAFDTAQSWYYPVVIIAVIAVFLTKNLQRSRIGKAFVAIRDNDRAASAVGINVRQYKMLSFFIGTFFAGIAGYLLVSTYSNADVAYFTFLDSVWLLGMLIIGGMGVVSGTIFGVVFLRLIAFGTNQLAPSITAIFPSLSMQVTSGFLYIIFGLIIIVFLIFEPRGISHLWDRIKNWYRIWPFSQAS